MSITTERIKERRHQLNMTLLYIAEKLNVKETTVQRYESGEIKNIKHDTIKQLADILQCSPSYLMGWQDEIYSIHDLDSNEILLLTKYRQLNKDSQIDLMNTIIKFHDKEQLQ